MNMRKANIRNTKTKCEIRSNTTGFRKSIVDLEQIFVFWKLLRAIRIALFQLIVWVFKMYCFSNVTLSVFTIQHRINLRNQVLTFNIDTYSSQTNFSMYCNVCINKFVKWIALENDNSLI